MNKGLETHENEVALKSHAEKCETKFGMNHFAWLRRPQNKFPPFSDVKYLPVFADKLELGLMSSTAGLVRCRLKPPGLQPFRPNWIHASTALEIPKFEIAGQLTNRQTRSESIFLISPGRCQSSFVPKLGRSKTIPCIDLTQILRLLPATGPMSQPDLHKDFRYLWHFLVFEPQI
jgi:hypothetical protein